MTVFEPTWDFTYFRFLFQGRVHDDSCVEFKWGKWVKYHEKRKLMSCKYPATVYDIGDPGVVEDVHSCVAHYTATMVDTNLGFSRVGYNCQRKVDV